MLFPPPVLWNSYSKTLDSEFIDVNGHSSGVRVCDNTKARADFSGMVWWGIELSFWNISHFLKKPRNNLVIHQRWTPVWLQHDSNCTWLCVCPLRRCMVCVCVWCKPVTRRKSAMRQKMICVKSTTFYLKMHSSRYLGAHCLNNSSSWLLVVWGFRNSADLVGISHTSL